MNSEPASSGAYLHTTPVASGASGSKPQAELPPPRKTPQANNGNVSAYYYDLCGNAKDCVERYLELSGQKLSDLKTVSSPCIDDSQLDADDMVTKGKLTSVASKIVLKFLWIARLTRPDIYWTVNNLARHLTKWSIACDKRLFRLSCWVHQTEDTVSSCFTGDKPSDCQLVMFSDASFAGDLIDSKSTSGGFLFLMGPRTCIPLGHLVKKQGAVSNSSTEAETIALDTCLRVDGLPALMLWEQV